MSTTFQNVFFEQRFMIQLISRVVSNYRKCGKDKFTAVNTRSRIAELEKTWADCKTLHVRLQQVATSEEVQRNPYFVQQEFFEAETEYFESMDVLTELFAKQTEGPIMNKQDGNRTENFSVCNDAHNSFKFALPRITIPPFNGDFLEWDAILTYL